MVKKFSVGLTLSDATFEKRRKVWGGALSAPPLENHEGVVRDPMLLFRSWSYIKMELT